MPFSKYILKKYIENSHLDIYESKQLRLIIEKKDNNTLIGTIDVFDFDHFHQRAGLGIFLEKSYRKKGLAKTTLELIINYCFSTLGLNLIYCNISINNTDSISLFKDAGFEIKGEREKWNKTSDGWENEYFLQILRSS